MKGTEFLDCGGPTFRISVGGKIFTFEMHPHCGPIAVDGYGEMCKRQPMKFLKAVSLWMEQGQRIQNGLCWWDQPGEYITKHLGGKNYMIVGQKPSVRGS